MPITFARRQGWLNEPHVDVQAEELLSVDERWKRWRDREEVKRLGFGAVVRSAVFPLVGSESPAHTALTRLCAQVFDCGGTALWNMDSSSLYLDAAGTPLPCHDSLWVSAPFVPCAPTPRERSTDTRRAPDVQDAPSATAWSSLFPHSALPPAQPSLSHAVHLACTSASLAHDESATLMAISRDAFALSTVLSVLHSLGWERSQAKAVEETFLVLGGAKGDDKGKGRQDDPAVKVDAAQTALEAGVSYFQVRPLSHHELVG